MTIQEKLQKEQDAIKELTDKYNSLIESSQKANSEAQTVLQEILRKDGAIKALKELLETENA